MKYEAMTDSHFENLYKYRETWVPCYFKHQFFPFLQSTQCSEGFNAVLKRYVNPHKSILNFVKQYQKIQTHILVREGSKDYRTAHLQTEMWSSYPIEKQAYGSYTRDLYEKFRDEFQLTTRYNVRPHGENLYEVYPNQEWVAKYGSRGYFVTVEASAGDYRCDCCKIERDDMLCCHILKVFNQLGVDEIPAHYILRRWTPMAIPNAPPAVEEQPDEMPPQSKKELRHANLMMDFGSLARVASASDAAMDIVKKHMRGARHEIKNLNMSKKKKPAAPTSGPSGGPPPSADGSAPPPSNSQATGGPAVRPEGPAQAPSGPRQQRPTSAPPPSNTQATSDPAVHPDEPAQTSSGPRQQRSSSAPRRKNAPKLGGNSMSEDGHQQTAFRAAVMHSGAVPLPRSPPAQSCWPVQQLSGYVPLNSGAAPHLSRGSTMTRLVQALRGVAPQLLMHTALARGPARPPMGPRPAIWPAPQTMGAIQPPRGPNAANTTYVAIP